MIKKLIIPVPVPNDTLESWIKILDDATKASLLAVLAITWFGDGLFLAKLLNLLSCLMSGYGCAYGANYLRVNRAKLTIKEEA
ncbi:hypothetical protein [Stenoxybacter acetivorans]|uniref:hypothetical protein n=1 Tax=Stenoxybacter acetivorans TaxID=422441 RepID=UPI0012ECA90F|nr:hypothetical protein [Stenoxybacter acetivorans]